jgi:serine/threonine protein phosphatase 1
MATIAVGDVHGNLPALAELLGQIRGEVTPEDVVVFLGDYIDRGPDSRGCVEAILEFRAGCAAEVVCLRGNHEDWMLRTREDYTRHSWLLSMEALDTVRSYSPEAEQGLREAASALGLQLYVDRCELPYGLFFSALPPAHAAFFEGLASSYRGSDCLCTHGGLDPALDLAQHTDQTFMWGDRAFPEKYRGGEVVVYGHWDNAEIDEAGWPNPRIVGRTIGIDTISHGVLTAVRLPDRRVFQSGRHVVLPRA